MVARKERRVQCQKCIEKLDENGRKTGVDKKIVWASSNLPRHSFIMWLALKNMLMTKEKLFE